MRREMTCPADINSTFLSLRRINHIIIQFVPRTFSEKKVREKNIVFPLISMKVLNLRAQWLETLIIIYLFSVDILIICQQSLISLAWNYCVFSFGYFKISPFLSFLVTKRFSLHKIIPIYFSLLYTHSEIFYSVSVIVSVISHITHAFHLFLIFLIDIDNLFLKIR